MPRRALPDINQPVFIAIDQGLDEHTPHERENGCVGANAERQRDDHDKRETWRFAEPAKSEREIVHKTLFRPQCHYGIDARGAPCR